MRWLSVTLAVLLIVAVPVVGFVHLEALDEAFGSGSPHYGRTTNMDKWVNPLPLLASFDVALVGLFFAWRFVRARAQSR